MQIPDYHCFDDNELKAKSRNPSRAEREARFNRMFYLVSGPKLEVRQFLFDSACPKF